MNSPSEISPPVVDDVLASLREMDQQLRKQRKKIQLDISLSQIRDSQEADLHTHNTSTGFSRFETHQQPLNVYDMDFELQEELKGNVITRQERIIIDQRGYATAANSVLGSSTDFIDPALLLQIPDSDKTPQAFTSSVAPSRNIADKRITERINDHFTYFQ